MVRILKVLFLLLVADIASAQVITVINSTANPVNVNCISGCSGSSQGSSGATFAGTTAYIVNPTTSVVTNAGTFIVQAEQMGNWEFRGELGEISTATWTSATLVNSAISAETLGFGTVLVTARPTGLINGGNIKFEGSDDGGANWFLVNLTRTVGGGGISSTSFDLAGETSYIMHGNVSGLTHFRLRLESDITGAGSQYLRIRAFANPADSSIVINQSNANSLRVQLSDGSNHSVLSPAGALKVDGTVNVGNLHNGTTVYVVNNSTVQVSNFPTLFAGTTVYVVNPATVTVSNLYTGTTVYVVNNSTMQVSNFPVSQAVTGTFWQATQPVSLAAAPSTPVTGTFWQATQPVSGNVGQSGAWTVSVGTGIYPVAVQAPTRVGLHYYVIASTVGLTTAESNLTLTKSSNTIANATAPKFVIGNAKKFRIQSIVVATRGHNTATAQTTTFSFRYAANGTCITTTTPVLFSARTATPAVANDWDRYVVEIPEGYEISGDGTATFCVSVNSTYVTNAPTADVHIIGYEY